ncbi:MAG: hypothetical protein RLZZ69_2591 [Cyanobacteriota bacterium]
MDVDGIGLLRAEFMIADIGIHPKEAIKRHVQGQFVDKMVKKLTEFCSAFYPRQVVYRATDFKTNEYRSLEGGKHWEPIESNPMLGFRGAYRYISDPEVFNLELQAIKEVREKYPNLQIMIPFVRSPEELRRVRRLVHSAGLFDDPHFKFWMMVELPVNIIMLEEFIKVGIDGISIGSNDLTMLIQGTDRDNSTVATEFNEMSPEVLWAIKKAIKTCNKHGITSSICGQAASRPEMAAILVRENRQARFLAEELAYLPREHGINIYEVGESERYSQIPAEILKLLQFIDRPHSPDNLKAALEVLQQRSLIPTQDLNALATSPEQFLYPTLLQPDQKPQVEQARRYCVNLLRARIELPHYQLIPFLGMTLKYTGSELATLQKLAEKVNQQTRTESSLKTAIQTLTEIVSAENFEGVEEDDGDRYTRANQVTIITMHKAKGLDWDYVFIPFLHQDILPGEPWIPNAGKFLGSFTLSEVARAQIRSLVHHQYISPEQPHTIPLPMAAWQEAVKLKQAEEYRLLYVAMTRAKRLLWMSAEDLGPFRWSVFRADRSANLQQKKPCPVLPALIKHLHSLK